LKTKTTNVLKLTKPSVVTGGLGLSQAKKKKKINLAGLIMISKTEGKNYQYQDLKKEILLQIPQMFI
jgi:hypothetical protein